MPKGRTPRQNRKTDNYSLYSQGRLNREMDQKRFRKVSIDSNGIYNTPDNPKIALQRLIPANLLINYEFDKFLKFLDSRDKKSIESTVKEIKNYSFVKNVDFEDGSIPTLIIKITDLDREYEDVIYETQYNLLTNISFFIDFYVKPF